MKKKSTSISQYIDCIHIYRDDIEQIYDILYLRNPVHVGQ